MTVFFPHIKVYVGLPDSTSRIAMIQYYLRDIDHRALLMCDTENIAAMTLGWSGSEIEVQIAFSF